MRYLLGFFFLMMYAGDELSLNISLGPGMSTKNLLLYLILVWIALSSAVERNRTFDLRSVLIPFALLIVYAITTWAVVAFILTPVDYDARGAFISIKSSLVDQYLTFVIFLFGVIRAKDAYWLLRLILWITIIGNVVTLIDSFNIPNLGILENAGRKAGRFDGFVGQPNSYGQLLVLFLAPTIVLYGGESGRKKFFAAIGVFSGALALLLTGSRGAWVGLIVGSAFAAFYLRREISMQTVVRVSVVGTLVCIIIVIVTVIAGYADVYLQSFEKFEGGTDRATSGRATLWKTALLAMIDNPISFITGYGYHAYDSSRQFFKAVHNVYLSYLYDLGVVGLVLFVAVFARILVVARSVIEKAGQDDRRYLIAMIFGLSAFLITLFFSEYHGSGYLLWAYLGVVMRIAMEVKAGVGFGIQGDGTTPPPEHLLSKTTGFDYITNAK